ncbi:MAG: peptidylprolyl isomerase [Kiritimatiellia bacterium]
MRSNWQMMESSWGRLLGVVVLAFALGAQFAGCSRTDQDDTAAPSRVVVSVDGVELTERELTARADLVGRLQQNRDSRLTMAELKKRHAAFRKVYPQVFVEDVVLSNYLAREGLALPQAMITNFQQRAAKTFGTGRKKTFADLKAVAGDLADRLDVEVMLEVRRQYVEDVLAERTPTNLPPDYVAQVQESVRRYNINMGLTNNLVYARATNVWNQLKAGAAFADMVKKYSEADDDEKEEGGEWDSMDGTQLQEEPALRKWFSPERTKVGEISPPIECDAGLSIVRYDGIDADEDSDGPTEYKFSRVHFLLPMFMEADTPENIVATARKTHASRLFKEKLAELVKAARVVFAETPAPAGK